MKFSSMANEAVLREVGARVRRERLNQNTTQQALATRAGLSRRVVVDLEGGKGCSLSSFVEILRALRKLDQLDSFLPDPGPSPIQLAELQGKERQRASGGRSKPKAPYSGGPATPKAPHSGGQATPKAPHSGGQATSDGR